MPRVLIACEYSRMLTDSYLKYLRERGIDSEVARSPERAMSLVARGDRFDAYALSTFRGDSYPSGRWIEMADHIRKMNPNSKILLLTSSMDRLAVEEAGRRQIWVVDVLRQKVIETPIKIVNLVNQ